MKGKIYTLLAGALLLVSCGNNEDVTFEKTPKIAISLVSEIPATVFPGEELNFDFLLEYDGGITSSYALIDGNEVESSRTAYSGSPKSVNVAFSYTAQDAYAGNTIDFAVCASGADGAVGHYDIPVFVLAAKSNINFTFPDDAPSEFEVTGETLSFPINIESGNIDIKAITTYKGDTVMPEMTFDVEEGEDARHITLDFEYTPTLGDTGMPTLFTFEVLDVNGNLTNAYYSVLFFKAASVELNEYSGVTMGLNKCTAAGQFINLVENIVYEAAGVGEHSAEVDLAVFWSGNASTIGVAFASPNAGNVTSIYPEATIVNTLGGTAADIPSNWAVRNETNFREIDIDADAFASIDTIDQIYEYFETGVQPTNDHVTFKKTAGSVIAFLIHRGDTEKIGIIRVTKVPGNNTGAVTFDYKIEK